MASLVLMFSTALATPRGESEGDLIVYQMVPGSQEGQVIVLKSRSPVYDVLS